MKTQNQKPSPLDEIVKNAIRFNVAKKFGPFKKCPECCGLLKSCELCQGRDKVSIVEIEAFNNPITKMMRNKKSH